MFHQIGTECNSVARRRNMAAIAPPVGRRLVDAKSVVYSPSHIGVVTDARGPPIHTFTGIPR
jgi:hypothetical protein